MGGVCSSARDCVSSRSEKADDDAPVLNTADTAPDIAQSHNVQEEEKALLEELRGKADRQRRKGRRRKRTNAPIAVQEYLLQQVQATEPVHRESNVRRLHEKLRSSRKRLEEEERVINAILDVVDHESEPYSEREARVEELIHVLDPELETPSSTRSPSPIDFVEVTADITTSALPEALLELEGQQLPLIAESPLPSASEQPITAVQEIECSNVPRSDSGNSYRRSVAESVEADIESAAVLEGSDDESEEPELSDADIRRLLGLSAEENSRLDEMKRSIDPEILRRYTETDLVRFLRARQWKLKEALKMFLAQHDWRCKYRPEDINPNELEKEAILAKMYQFGRTRSGMPVIYMRPGRDTNTDNDLKLKYLVYLMERATEQLAPGNTLLCWLADLQGFSRQLIGFSHLRMSKIVLNVLQNNYPERLGKMVFINPPSVFSIFWKVVSKVVDAKTRQKVVMLDNAKKAAEFFAKEFEPNQLEQCYGGSSPHQYNHQEWMAQERARFQASRQRQLTV